MDQVDRCVHKANLDGSPNRRPCSLFRTEKRHPPYYVSPLSPYLSKKFGWRKETTRRNAEKESRILKREKKKSFLEKVFGFLFLLLLGIFDLWRRLNGLEAFSDIKFSLSNSTPSSSSSSLWWLLEALKEKEQPRTDIDSILSSTASSRPSTSTGLHIGANNPPILPEDAQQPSARASPSAPGNKGLLWDIVNQPLSSRERGAASETAEQRPRWPAIPTPRVPCSGEGTSSQPPKPYFERNKSRECSLMQRLQNLINRGFRFELEDHRNSVRKTLDDAYKEGKKKV